MIDYLKDKEFLRDMDRIKNKKMFAKIILLSFDEKPIKEIQGEIVSGNLNVNGSSSLRRTINLSLSINDQNQKIDSLDNLIALNKKIKVYIGYKNVLKKYKDLYDDIIWFPCGLFIISTAQISYSVSSLSLSITGKDKMVLLDGSVGGTLPASVTFHERYEYDDNGDLKITTPTIFQIIQESVVHYGKENVNNVIINDLSETAKLLVRYRGDTPIWFSDNYNSFIISDSSVEGFMKNKFSYGQDIGYMETDLTYPGELIFEAGSTVVSLLDKICTVLGNYEYFYDLNGQFIFQEKKNYLNNYYTPIVNLDENSYVQNFSNTKYAYSIYDSETVISYNKNPNYTNIKNDFIVWGKKEDSLGDDLGIRYHLAIDTKPDLNLCTQYMWEIPLNENKVLRYEYTQTENPPKENAVLIGKPCEEWREELYRIALENNLNSSIDGDYDQELIAEWRKLFDTLNEDWEKAWRENFESSWAGWNPQVFLSPNTLDYWLDFIDTFSYLQEYSVKNIGRRTKVLNDDNIKSIYNSEVPDVIFIENNENKDELILHYSSIGQKFCLLQSNQLDFFTASSTGASAYDKIREMLYLNLIYNTQITITCQPIYYLEPNTLIYAEDKNSGISGEYIISSFSLPLTYSGTMSINATEALTRV